MVEMLTSGTLIMNARGPRSRKSFAGELGIDEPLLSRYENGKVYPSAGTWVKIARIADQRYAPECYRRAGLEEWEIVAILKERVTVDPQLSGEQRHQIGSFLAKELLLSSGHLPEEVTLPQNPPAPESEKSKTVEEWLAKNNATIGEGQIAQEVKPKMPREKEKSKKKPKK